MRSPGFDLPLLGGAVLFLLVVALAPLQPATAAWQAIQPGQGQAQGQGQGHDLGLARRSKRSWVWNQFFVVEEFKMPEPFKIGKLHSDQDPGDGSVLYLLTGEGAESLFTIDEHTGDIRVSQALDREQQSLYTLLAQVVDAVTRQPLEPPTQFVVKVQDINDNEPRFPDEPYLASVPEMSPIGTSVTRVTATDADDSSYGNSARVVYRLLEGQPYFSIDANTGEIRTAHSNLDREARSLFRVVIEGKDMAGQKGGLTGTATVTITLEDVNDNAPLFPQGTYRASVSEAAVPGMTVGRVRAQDADEGDNARVDYRIVAGDRAGAFSIATDPSTQDGVVTLAQPLDYERKHAYTLTVEAWNPVAGGSSSTAMVPLAGSTRLLVSVEDADEGPVFSPAAYEFEVAESQGPRHPLGTVTALDPDAAARPVRYSIDRNTDVDRHFDVDPLTGVLTVARALDRESTELFNITVIATQADDQALVGRAPVTVRVLDVNDNAPELLGPDELVLCENTPPGQAVHIFSAVDRDENHVSSPVKISLSAPSANSNFTLTDHHNGTASLSLRRRLSRGGAEELSTLGLVLPLSVVLEDSGSPGALSSTATVRVRVCACSRRGAVTACTLQALAVLPAGLSVHALIAILACLLILLILILLFVSVRRRKKKAPSLPEDDDICENIVRYDEEGGGEEDTATFDLVTLTYPHARPLTSSSCSGGGGAHHNNNNHHHHGNNNSHHHNNHHHHNNNNHDGVRQPNRVPLATAASAATTTTTAASAASNNHYHHSHHNQQQQHRHQHHHLPPTTTSCSGGTTAAAAANHGSGNNNNNGASAAPSGVRSRVGTCMDEFIQVRLREVDADPAAPPYDSVQVYGYEGSGSSVAGSLGSLSSLGSLGSESSSRSQGAPSTSTDGDQSYDYLHEWGPRFRTLAHLYGHVAAAAPVAAPTTAATGAAAAVGAASASAAAAGSGSAAAGAAAAVGMAGKNVDRGGG